MVTKKRNKIGLNKSKRDLFPPEICKMKGEGYCPRPLESMKIFKNKWSLAVLITIGNFKNLRFGKLLEKIDGITAKVLSERLSTLETKDIVSKKIYSIKPPHVEYTLTKKGTELYNSVQLLVSWSYKEVSEK